MNEQEDEEMSEYDEEYQELVHSEANELKVTLFTTAQFFFQNKNLAHHTVSEISFIVFCELLADLAMYYNETDEIDEIDESFLEFIKKSIREFLIENKEIIKKKKDQ